MPLISVEVVFAACALIALVLTHKGIIDRPSLAVEDRGEYIIVRPTPLLRLFRLSGKHFKKTDLVTLQLAQSISIFNRSNTAVDIWLHARHRKAAINQLKGLLPHAEYVEVDGSWSDQQSPHS